MKWERMRQIEPSHQSTCLYSVPNTRLRPYGSFLPLSFSFALGHVLRRLLLPCCHWKAEIRFDPALTSEHALADGITSLGYPSRCITVVSPNEGGAGARNSGPRGVIVVEVTGARSPECVSKVRLSSDTLISHS